MTDIDLTTAKALRQEGLAIIPTAAGEKRPFGHWAAYQRRLPALPEIEKWFATPRAAGIVTGAVSGDVEVIDLDTHEGYARFAARYGGEVVCEESPHGGHAWYRCDEIGANARPAEKVDTRAEGGFCVVYQPARLLAHGVPRVTPEKRAEMLAFAAEKAVKATPAAKEEAPPAKEGTLRAGLIAQGWKSLGVKADGREHFSRPGAAHPGRTDATLSADGSGFRVWSTSAQERPLPAPTPPPQVLTAAEVFAAAPELPEAILPYCRRGSFALIAADPKAGKTVFAIRTALKACAQGRRVLFADMENGPACWIHRVRQYAQGELPESLLYLDCREQPTVGYIAAGLAAAGGVDLLFIDPWGLLASGPDGVEDESLNTAVGAFFMRMRAMLAPFGCATVILHHQSKKGGQDKLCFAGAGASALTRYVQSICRLREDASRQVWFECLCREFDNPPRPCVVRRLTGSAA